MGTKISELSTATTPNALAGFIPVITGTEGSYTTEKVQVSELVNTDSGGGGASVATSTTAPSSPSDGDLWFNENTAELYIYTTTLNAWIQTNGGGSADDDGDIEPGALGGIYPHIGTMKNLSFGAQPLLSAPSGIKWLDSAQGVQNGYDQSAMYGVYENITSENLLIVNSGTTWPGTFSGSSLESRVSLPVDTWNGGIQIEFTGNPGFSNPDFFVAAPGGKFALLGRYDPQSSTFEYFTQPWQVLRSWGGYTATQWLDAGEGGLDLGGYGLTASIAGPNGKL